MHVSRLPTHPRMAGVPAADWSRRLLFGRVDSARLSVARFRLMHYHTVALREDVGIIEVALREIPANVLLILQGHSRQAMMHKRLVLRIGKK